MSEDKAKSSELDAILGRVRELTDQGIDSGFAWRKARLEKKIDNWPSGWEDNLQVLIYGDFEPPSEDIYFPLLGITIYHEKLKNTLSQSNQCVLKASVTIREKSIPAIMDAVRRINILLGTWTLVEQGNPACGWWSHITHDSGSGVIGKWVSKDLNQVIEHVIKLPEAVRQKFDAALYWVREPRSPLMERYRSDVLRIYASYWNAFECLVEAVNLLVPQSKISRSEKQKQVDEFIKVRRGKLSSDDIVRCYQEIVNPGLVGKASHALRVCFPKDAEQHIAECFRLPVRRDRLYDVRNAIDHGDIDAEHLEELLRVQSRLTKLWRIVWGMFGRLIQGEVKPGSSLQS